MHGYGPVNLSESTRNNRPGYLIVNSIQTKLSVLVVCSTGFGIPEIYVLNFIGRFGV